MYKPMSAGVQAVNIVSNNVRSLSLNVPILTGKTQYYLGNVRRLQDTLLQSIMAPYDSGLSKNIQNLDTVAEATIEAAFLVLLNDKGDRIIDEDPLWMYKPDTTFKPVQVFDNLKVDWEKSYIIFPDNTRPAADTGKILILRIGYCCQTDAR